MYFNFRYILTILLKLYKLTIISNIEVDKNNYYICIIILVLNNK